MPTKKGGKPLKKHGDDAFEGLLAQLQTVTSKGSDLKTPNIVTREERKMKQVQRHAEAKRQKEADLARMIEKQRQQQQLRAIIDQFTGQRPAALPILHAPKVEMTFESKSSGLLNATAGSMQGWRSTMEDAHVIVPSLGAGSLLGVFDGHAGNRSSATCRVVFPVVLLQHYDSTVPQGFTTQSITRAFLDIDAALRKRVMESGTTAVVVYVSESHIVCGSVGDSRALLCRQSKCIPLSKDHKPENSRELQRITAAGGTVTQNRVNGNLAMSRALGDFSYKSQPDRPPEEQLVIAVPDVVVLERESGDDFLVLACDGIFDVMSNEDVVEFIHNELHDSEVTLQSTCERLCQKCLAPTASPGMPARTEGTDNMTVVIAQLKNCSTVRSNGASVPEE